MANARTRKKKSKPTAADMDRHHLYQESVQEPSADVEFFRTVYKKEFGRRPHMLREDFCGTGYLSCTWVQDHRDNTAMGIDLDPDPLQWGAEHNVSKLKPKQKLRVSLIEGNALEVRRPKVEVVAALNFSYFIFKTRDQLRDYFRAAYKNLKGDGIFVVDIMGGPESQQEVEEERVHDDFTYIWEQLSCDAITNEIQCAISFSFEDGSEARQVFNYDWRLWSAPEVREVMVEAGFDHADLYWEGTDEDTEEGDGNFTHQEHAENCESWVAYIVGVKKK